MIQTKPKIQDVARIAGVSTATVSRALNTPERVAEKTRSAVLNAVEATGYVVDLAARGLRQRTTGAVVVLVPNLGNPFFSQILAAIERAMSRAGYSVLIADTHQPQVRKKRVLEYLHNNRADGLIVLDGSLPPDLLRPTEKGGPPPPIVFACEWTDKISLPSVQVDNRKGAALAVRHLVGLGHSKIGQISGPAGNMLTSERRAGALAELASHGLQAPAEWMFEGDFSLESGTAAADRWSELSDRPTAVFCASDLMAFGFISELNRRGVTVPADLSVVGFDDIEISGRFVPPLTTIRQPRDLIGSAAAEILINCIRSGDSESAPKIDLLPVELVVRASTAPPSDA